MRHETPILVRIGDRCRSDANVNFRRCVDFGINWAGASPGLLGFGGSNWQGSGGDK